MSKPSEAAGARRLAAELELARALQGLLVHEFGNPLQSLLVLLELCRDDLFAASGESRQVQRLDRALVSVARLREVLLAAGRVRASLAGEAEQDWGALLDALLELVGPRLTQLRANLVRFTDDIDRRLVGGEVQAAALSVLLGACERIRELRSDGFTLELHGRVLQGQTVLRVAVQGPTGPVELDAELLGRAEDLLAGHPAARCRRDGHSLVIWSA